MVKITDKKRIFLAFSLPFLFVLLMWVVLLSEIIFAVSFKQYGLIPRTTNGLLGIITSPFIHGDIEHLLSNSFPILILGTALFYFYKTIAIKSFFIVWIMTSCWVWIYAREASHIGASGLVYGLTAFLFVSGLIRKESQLIALSFLVIFLYGGIVWGVFPDFYPDRNISWETHLWGSIAGIITAIYYRNHNVTRKKYSWDFEEDDEPETLTPTDVEANGEIIENSEEKLTNSNPDIRYIYKPNINKEDED